MTEALQKMNDAITLLAINDLMLRQRNISEAEHAAIKQKIERMYLSVSYTHLTLPTTAYV